MLQGTTLHGWKIGEPVTKWWRGKYVHLYRVTKACAQCQQEMTLDVTKAALMGTAKNSGFHLTRCLECRAATRSQPSTSRPVVLDAPLQSTAQPVAPAADTITELEVELRSELFRARKKIAELEQQLRNKPGPW